MSPISLPPASASARRMACSSSASGSRAAVKSAGRSAISPMPTMTGMRSSRSGLAAMGVSQHRFVYFNPRHFCHRARGGAIGISGGQGCRVKRGPGFRSRSSGRRTNVTTVTFPEETVSDDTAYTPPKVWTWNKASGGRFANINRPVAGATQDKELPVGRHPLQLYSLATPNGVKVTVMLEELLALGHQGAEYDAWLIKIGNGDQFGSGFVSVNPNSKIPALMD